MRFPLSKAVRILLLGGLVALAPTWAADASAPAAPPAEGTAAEGNTVASARLTTGAAVTLGLVEGITEYLPVSSTGHLIIANDVLGLNDETPLHDDTGAIRWWKAPSPKHPEGEPLTRKLAADTYAVVIQVGAILAVVGIFWDRLWSIVMGLVGRSPAGLRLLRNIVVGCVPAAVIGVTADDWIDAHLFSVPTVIGALVFGAGMMFLAERRRKAREAALAAQPGAQAAPELLPSDLTVKQAAIIGAMQCVAFWPGMSRSMVTMVGGYTVGLRPARAAEFSFLLGLPTLGGAALLKALKHGPAMVEVLGWSNILLGLAIATVAAAVAVRFLVSYLSKHGLEVFAFYRLALAVGLVVYLVV